MCMTITLGWSFSLSSLYAASISPQKPVSDYDYIHLMPRWARSANRRLRMPALLYPKRMETVDDEIRDTP
jgi:hypothetical protein